MHSTNSLAFISDRITYVEHLLTAAGIAVGSIEDRDVRDGTAAVIMAAEEGLQDVKDALDELLPTLGSACDKQLAELTPGK